MNKYIIGLLAAGAGAFFLISNRKKTASKLPEDKQPVPELKAAETDKVFDANMGEGAALVRNRIESLFNSINGQQIKDNTAKDPFSGLDYKTGVKQVVGSIYGSASNFPAVPTQVDAGFINWMKDMEDLPSFESVKDARGMEGAKTVFQNLLSYKEYTFWPSDIEEIINQGAFGKATKADKDKSERYNAFTEDMKKFAGNMVSFVNSYSANIKNQAVVDLKSAGYNFVGL